MKKILTVFCSFLCMICFSACNASVELSGRGIVGALGIDYGNGIYKVSVLFFNTDLAEDAQSVFDVEYVFGEGQDLHEAFEDARLSTSKTLFFGHNTSLVLGRNLVETQIYDAVTYLSQNKETRLNVSVFMADGKAEEIIKLKTSDKAHISGSIERLANSHPKGLDVKVQLFQLLQELPQNGVKGMLPVIEPVRIQREAAQQDDPEEFFDIAVKKIAILDYNVVLGEVAGDNMTGIFLLQNRVDTLNITVRLKDGDHAYAQLTHIKTSFYIDRTTSSQMVHIFCTGSLAVTGQSENEIGSADLRELKDAFEQEAEYMIDTAYNYTKDKLHTDLFLMQWYVSQATKYQDANNYFKAGSMPVAKVQCQFGITG